MSGDLDHECGRYCKSGTQSVDGGSAGGGLAGVKECNGPSGRERVSCLVRTWSPPRFLIKLILVLSVAFASCQCHLAIVVRWCVLGRLRPNAAHGEKPGHVWGSNIQSYEWVIGHVDGSGRALRVDRGRKCTGCGASYHNWYGPFKQKDENGNPHGLSE